MSFQAAISYEIPVMYVIFTGRFLNLNILQLRTNWPVSVEEGITVSLRHNLFQNMKMNISRLHKE
jgi:hypothetical protein